MNHTKVVSPNSELKLSKGLNERHTLYISNSSSQLKRQYMAEKYDKSFNQPARFYNKNKSGIS